jgi:hypothetical protein
MIPINGHAGASANDRADGLHQSAPLPAVSVTATGNRLIPEQIKELVAELEVPFDPFIIEWRITHTTKANGKLRGQVIPYADQRAYTDRLNALVSPAGWTRKYAVHTSANFQRGDGEKIVAKVFVTCDLTIFGVGSHSATGEEWADDDNAGTAAEAQAFKRACSCFGLGRYLYYFSGIWMDLDERKRPHTVPKLAGWATPEGWRQGLRPQRAGDRESTNVGRGGKTSNANQNYQNGSRHPGEHEELVGQITAMAELLGKSMYRGLLKRVARAWNPKNIHEIAMLQRVLAHMQSAARGLRRLHAALEQTGPDALPAILRSLNLKSLDQMNDLETLREIVRALESKARE